MTSEELKQFCKERNLTYKELGELIGMSEGGLQNAIKKDSISDQTTKAIELLKEIEILKEQLADYENLKQLLKKALL
ncbi:TPA: helix-turn-helix transcriptional regulator [Campylobacter coli]|uniref:helix-turn-helix domain-containing protein n=1 Tax=Campylobacter coli TaxID=195 RepID=UPI00094C811D|nr:helix-turn-helix transcriptional regulator [Campylobacter coli]EAJ9110067.1 XRE family transcriptional regulator [Campylobacter jejuni]EAH8149300.1 XRE family transcriptional regulator [Campylobacter coli]EAK0805715.1 XRE family transcriptional regulator [Campylobacter coli]EAL3864817.1 XRE family transcriptional regulator [Campylobacter coli]ECL2265912.1 helix-turn-helix transcriptional regulator [Campylobacter jejuni]